MGSPQSVLGLTHIGDTGTDDTSAVLLQFDEGQLASIVASQESYDVKDAVIYGTDGRIDVHPPWYKGSGMTIYRTGEEPQTITLPFEEGFNGYEYEARETMNCIAAGKIESEIMPLAETLSIMETMDTLREAWGIKYPGE